MTAGNGRFILLRSILHKHHGRPRQLRAPVERSLTTPVDPSDTYNTANAINKSLASVITSLPPLDLSSLPAYLPSLPPPTVSPWDVYAKLQKVKTRKAAGPNGIPVSTEYSKAFDRVCHTVAIRRLLDIGLRPSLVRWVASFLTNRYQAVRYHGALSDMVRVTCGLPQGTLLGPLIFTSYINSAAQQAVSTRWKFVDDLNMLEVRKLIRLLEEIMGEKENKTIIFVETKRRVDDLTRRMRRDGWPAMCIHGDKSQPERDWVLNEFRTGSAPILVATDVASRGLDITDVKFVINFDYPGSAEDYVHRIGRTARSERTGTAYTFFTPNNMKQAKELVSVLQEARQQINPKLIQMVDAARGSFGGRGDRRRYRTGGGSRDDRGGGRDFRDRGGNSRSGGYGQGGGSSTGGGLKSGGFTQGGASGGMNQNSGSNQSQPFRGMPIMNGAMSNGGGIPSLLSQVVQPAQNTSGYTGYQFQ
ncbi:DDX17 [Branchiostoma lanceolatum]|uniref:RNA helicase n=1 Tax=Branchiostoma lanceolatum TaxID=7740 RepID=A0A8J9Z7I7_BRALA|nr:DDX17 [Branchiostoma lanceolatum]